MDTYCDVVNQRFVRGIMDAAEEVIRLTQNDDQPLRLFMVQPSVYKGSRFPFYYTEASGDEDQTCIVSLRDVTASPLTLASTVPMTAIVNGFDGVFHLNTQEVATFLAGRSQADCDFCIDMIDGSGHRIRGFTRSIPLLATDSGTVTQIPGVLYDTNITGLTGGGATNLDGIATVAKTVGSLQILVQVISGARSESSWQLIAGTNAEDEDGGIVRPDDYDGTTNAKVWVRVDGL